MSKEAYHPEIVNTPVLDLTVPKLLAALESMCFMASHANLEEAEKQRIMREAREAIKQAKGE